MKQLDVNFFFDFDHYSEMKGSSECDSDCVESDCEGKCVELKEDKGGIGRGSNLYETGFTKVSKFLAFDLLPQLKIRTHKRFE